MKSLVEILEAKKYKKNTKDKNEKLNKQLDYTCKVLITEF